MVDGYEYNRGVTIVAPLAGLVVAPVVWRVVDSLAGVRSCRGSVLLWTVVSLAGVGYANPDRAAAVVLFPLAVAGVVLAHVDRSVRLLPDVVVLNAYPLVAAVYIVAAVVTGDAASLLRSGAASAAAFVGFAALAAVGGMGFGDAKLAGLLGLALGWLSWTVVLTATVLGFMFAAPLAAVALLRGGRDTTIPFGPSMLLGALAALVVA